jgi:formylglycine-generating enzyme required for sulfatase activity
VHGHFPGNNHFWPGPDPFVPNANLPSDPGGGVMVVGSYPSGASRDGVMDLAGNVCEWVNDWLQPYTVEAKTDPHVWDRPSPYRAIRGSSWGYYGRSLRVTDREFNHPVYGGYIYIGFRVALPEAGLRKLAEKER